MTRTAVSPNMLRWARDRAQLDVLALTARFPKLEAWEAEEVQPTLKQLEDYARATHTPIGFFFLPAPPTGCGWCASCAIRCTTRTALTSVSSSTACRWDQVWARESWLEILGRYLIAQRDRKKQIREIIFPRYHQLDVTKKLQAAVLRDGPSGRFQIS